MVDLALLAFALAGAAAALVARDRAAEVIDDVAAAWMRHRARTAIDRLARSQRQEVHP